VTASAKIIKELAQHPQTERAITKFREDIDAWLV
jgi:hypothetical protein